MFDKNQTFLIKYPEAKQVIGYQTPGTVTTIGEDAFAYSINLISIELTDGVTTIEGYAFF